MKTPQARRAVVFLLLYVIAVAYASLYPWEFYHSANAAPLKWLPFATPGFLLDFLLNIVFYIPLGAATFLAIDAGAPGLFFAVAIGFTLSFGIEEIQRYTATRVGDYNDIVSNTLGTAFGAIAAYVWTHAHRRWFPPALARRLAPEGVVLAALWLAWNGFLLLPALSRRTLPDGESSLGWIRSVNEALGVVTIAIALRPGAFAMKKALAPLFLLWLIIQELTPFQLGTRQDFSWLPFKGLFHASPEVYYPLVFGKLFFYTAVVWAMRIRGAGWFWSASIPLALLAASEWAQIYIPDRSAETTDLVLMAVGAYLLWMAAPGLSPTRELDILHAAR